MKLSELSKDDEILVTVNEGAQPRVSLAVAFDCFSSDRAKTKLDLIPVGGRLVNNWASSKAEVCGP